MMYVLGIETSCDETAVAVVSQERKILSHKILSQEHHLYGGVMPEVAARSHLEVLPHLIKQTLDETDLSFSHLSGIAATAGPGLLGGLIVGMTMAKAISLCHALPFIGVNHLEGHALAVHLEHSVPFPYLLLLASGGHCQLIRVEGVGQAQLYGTTLDDAVGEAFDKVGRLLGLPYPGGPHLEVKAKGGNPHHFPLPRPLIGRPGCDFSFSGLKNAVRLTLQAHSPLSEADRSHLAASFQEAVVSVLVDRLNHALQHDLTTTQEPVKAVVCAGGVAANQTLRTALAKASRSHGKNFFAPSPLLCTDNGAMIAWAGLERLKRGYRSPLTLSPRPRWPLQERGSPTSP